MTGYYIVKSILTSWFPFRRDVLVDVNVNHPSSSFKVRTPAHTREQVNTIETNMRRVFVHFWLSQRNICSFLYFNPVFCLESILAAILSSLKRSRLLDGEHDINITKSFKIINKQTMKSSLRFAKIIAIKRVKPD